MMYSAMDEAFVNNAPDNYQDNKPTPKQFGVKPYDNYADINVKDSYDKNNNDSLQDWYVNNMQQHHNASPVYFTAQGDMGRQGNNFGTLLEDTWSQKVAKNFKDTNIDSIKQVTDTDSAFSIDTIKSDKSEKIDHQKCIDKMISILTTDNDNLSLVSLYSSNDDVYKHVNKCRYCKNKINEEMKKYYKSEPKEEPKSELLDKKYSFGYDIKELAIIIISGIILVLILDLLVKLGRKTK